MDAHRPQGGAEPRRAIVMLGTAFETMGGISAVVNIYRRAGLFERFPIAYLTTHRDGTRACKFGTLVKAWWRFVELLLAKRVALVHVHSASGASFWRKLLFLLPAFVARVPTVFHLHGGAFDQFYAVQGRLGKWVIRRTLDRVGEIVVLSERWRSWMCEVSINPNVEILHNPIEIPLALAPAFREPQAILCLGRLGVNKGTFDLVEAVARLVPTHPNVKVLLAGDGDLDGVRRKADQLGIGRHVEILGWVVGDAKAQLLARASIYTLPSYAEGLPVSILEAMAAGLPVVTTPVGGIPEAVSDGIDGLFIAPGDVPALAAALRCLLDDAALRERMGAAGRAKMEQTFATTRVMPALEEIYRSLGVTG